MGKRYQAGNDDWQLDNESPIYLFSHSLAGGISAVYGHTAPIDSGGQEAATPEAAAAGGKKGGGGSGGTATTTTGGSTTTGGTTTTTSGGTTSTTLTNTFPTLTLMWQPLNAPTGDSDLPTDTYFANSQWNLTASAGGINAVKAWQNYTGTGIKVGIIDDGIDYNHPDLKPNYLFDQDYDAATNGGTDAFGTVSEKHGTTVAGVLAAARDGSGIVGTAYNAAIAGIHISYSGGDANQFFNALNYLGSSDMDAANASWGVSTPYGDNFYSSPQSKSVLQYDVTNGRGGLGVNVVFAAGNGREVGDNVNYHNFQNNPNVIAVGATDYYGHVTSFSNPGAALLVSAPGMGIYSDDRLGGSGYSSRDYASVAGTSYSAPTVSGVVALMLQANPNLGYRDVQEILAYSAKNSDATHTGWTTNGAHDWNGGGLHFSHDYGFGLVVAATAVRLAESWQKQSTFANMSVQAVAHTDNLTIPDGSGGLQSRMTLGTSERLDKVVVDLNITHALPSDLTVMLTSPSGTTAVLASHPTNGTGTGIVFQTTANNFWGEDAKGEWTLTVNDGASGNVGKLVGWTLQALGDAASTPVVYIYTDEYSGAIGSSRDVLHDVSGKAGINTAAVTTGSYLDLNPGSFDIIAGRTLQVGYDTMLKTAWGGDGNDTIIANGAGNMIEAGRGDDTIVAGAGADKMWGGPGRDVFVFNAFSQASDTIGDFAPGNDAIDLRGLLASTGYSGVDPAADGWLLLAPDATGTGTNILVDAHNGLGLRAVVDVLGMTPAGLHQGVDFWVTVSV